jgi:hypothetical protein
VEAAVLQADDESVKSLRDFQIKEKTEDPAGKSSIK